MNAIIDIFEDSVRLYPDHAYLWEKTSDKFIPTTYKETKELVYKFAAGLIKLGIYKGDRIAILAEGCNSWVISELGMFYAGVVNVPLSVKLAASSEIELRVKHSGARMIVVSKNQTKKVQSLKEKLPDLEKIILLDPQSSYDSKEIFYGDVLSIGEKYLDTHADEFNRIWQSIQPSDPANICYTSGTTAEPKGIVLTHRNYTANVEQGMGLFNLSDKDIQFVILPLDHAYAHTGGLFIMMKAGGSIAFTQIGKTAMETLKNIPLNIKEMRPHIILSVPALAKNFKKNIENGIRGKGRITEILFHIAIRVAYKYNGLGNNKGRGLKLFLKPINGMFDFIIFRKIRESFGGRMRFFVGGGALLDIKLQKFFYAIGIPMFQGYGLTEAAPILTASSETFHKLGSSGIAVQNCELKICNEKEQEIPHGEKGEIVCKGENVMAEYWRNKEATAEVLKNGWLHTGDMGYMDKDNFLYVTGRFKSLLIADDGEKFSPEGIEEAFVSQSEFIEQCMLYNNQNSYTVGLVVLNRDAIKRWMKTKHFNTDSDEEIKAALKMIESEITEYRLGGTYEKMFPQRWLPASIGILDQAFMEENQMINSTMKMVRGKIVEFYKARIAYLYTPGAKDICNKENNENLRRFLKQV